MSNEELSEIVKPENGYTEAAIKVASDILQSDRSEYFENVKKHQKKIEDNKKINYDDVLFNLSKEVHSIKNMLLFFVILTILGIISILYMDYILYTAYIEIPNLF